MSANAGPVPLAHLDMSVADGLSPAQVRSLVEGGARNKVVSLRRPA
jgi:hypothetical protein